MSDIYTDLRALLIGDAGVSSRVGARVIPNAFPEAVTLPAITFEQVGRRDVKSTDGARARPRFRMRLHCWANRKSDAVATAAAVRAALRAAEGGAFKYVTETGEFDVYEPQTNTYQQILDFEIRR